MHKSGSPTYCSAGLLIATSLTEQALQQPRSQRTILDGLEVSQVSGVVIKAGLREGAT